MKRIVTPPNEPAVLRAFREANPNATWDEFKNQPGNEEVFDCLSFSQGQICAYCEIRISRGLEGQVEHYRPKSVVGTDGNPHLEFSNLLAGCEGGTVTWKAGRSEYPIEATMHCGPLKDAREPDGLMVDPRTIPADGLPWRTTSQGFLIVDRPACVSKGIDPDLAERTLNFLGLNRRVLVRLRAAIVDKLLEDFGDSQLEPEILLPDRMGCLQPFWSTVRSFGGEDVEPFIAGTLRAFLVSADRFEESQNVTCASPRGRPWRLFRNGGDDGRPDRPQQPAIVQALSAASPVVSAFR